jgi:hypothetical protein
VLWIGGITACADLGLVGDDVVDTADLLLLPVQSTAAAIPARTVTVGNLAASAHQLIHSDGFNTVFLELRVPAGALESVDGTPVAPDGVVSVTMQAEPGVYGAVLSPGSLEFTAGQLPTLVFSFGQYGDFSIADGSATYASRLEYETALALWTEVSPGRWTRVPGSGLLGVDEVGGAITAPGTFVVAAER